MSFKLTLGLFLVVLIITMNPAVYTQSEDPRATSKEDLIHLYSPILQFTTKEKFYPITIDYFISNSVLKFRDGVRIILVDSSPNPQDLALYNNSGYYLESIFGGYKDILNNYAYSQESLGYTIYGRVNMKEDVTIVQYWFFYAYNDAASNQHEGDWEGITVFLSSSGLPEYAAYTQHNGGQKAVWSSVEKINGTHPVVYVAEGSHANYFRPYLWGIDPSRDVVGSDGLRMTPNKYSIIVLEELGSHSKEFGWLDFGGRFGKNEAPSDDSHGYAGPYGPSKGYNALKWIDPVGWSNRLMMIGATYFTVNYALLNPKVPVIILIGFIVLWILIRSALSIDRAF